jgi:signal transduction histidine kinase
VLYASRMTLKVIAQATVENVRTTPRPPLTKRLRPVHWTAIDYVVGVLFGLIVFASIRMVAVSAPYGAPVPNVQPGPGLLIRLGLAAGVVIAVATRRRHPMTSLCLLLGGSVLVAILSGGTTTALYLFAPAAYVLYLIVATFDNRRAVGHALAGVFLILLIDAAIMTPRNGDTILRGGGVIPVIFAVATAWSAGYIVRQRRRYTIGLQEEAASKAVAVERLRIARELHDVVAHSMSVIAVQAGYGQYVIDNQPRDAKEALGAIAATSREALEEMRRMLGALRQADEAGADSPEPAGSGGLASLFSPGVHPQIQEPEAAQDGPAAAPLLPAPGLTDLDRLITRTASAGVRAEVHRTGTPRDLPGSIELSAYRIIQEALTNVVKHAHASACSVLLDYGAEELTIEITDSGAGVPALAFAMAGGGPFAAGLPSGGHGIIGMRERVSLLGGEFTATPLPGYGFQVSARIPLPQNGTR